MTRTQKHALALAVADRAAQLVAYWEDNTTHGYYQELAGIDREEAAQVIANWLAGLPTGDGWPTELPLPTRKGG